MASPAPRDEPRPAIRPSFYFGMALLIAAVVVFGFSFTIGPNLLHPATPRPGILYVHAVLFSAWVVFFIVQTALVSGRQVSLHRRLGLVGLGLGTAIPVVGVATAIAMTRLRVGEGVPGAFAGIIVPLWDMVAFTVAFGLAFCLRGTPEAHRRLMLMASCALTAAAFGRFPSLAIQDTWFYAGVDLLVLLGIARDLLVGGRVHTVYLVGLPLMILGQLAAMSSGVRGSPAWLAIAEAMLR
jgi:hypothetical protein